MSSSACLAMISKYESISNQVSSLFGYIDACSKLITDGKGPIEALIIDGEPIDKGILDSKSAMLDGLVGVFNTVIAECQVKINEYRALYEEALAREAEEARLAALGKVKNEDKVIELY